MIPYARMTDVERCAHVGQIIRNTWFARALHPDKVDGFLSKGHKVARLQQVPAWLTGDESVRTHVFMGGRGSGKDLDIETSILTSNRGWTTMGDIRVGDVVFDEKGAMCNVTHVSDITDQKKMYKLTFSDKSELVASDTHEWVTTTHAERKSALRRRKPQPGQEWRSKGLIHDKVKARQTLDLIDTLRYGKRGDLNHAISVCGALQYPTQDLPVDPYDLGVWLGDGSKANRVIHLADRDAHAIVPFMRSITSDPPLQEKGCSTYRLDFDAWDGFKRLGLRNNKHVPRLYQEAPVADRRLLLAGLLDTDGYIDPGSKCELTLCHEVLAHDAYELILGLGIKATMSESDATIDGRVVGRRWRIQFSIYLDHEIPLQVPFKKDRLKASGKQGSRQRHRMITSIERVPNVPCRCITVDSPSHLYLAGRTLIPTHNSSTASPYVASEALIRPNLRAGVLGPDFKVSVGVCIKGRSGIDTLIRQYDESLIAKWDDVKNILTLINGSQVFCFSSEYPKSLEGPEFHLYWVDEIAELMGATGDNCVYRKRAEPGIRLVGDKGEPIRKIITGTPEATELIADLHAKSEKYPDTYAWTQLATRDNIDNLDREMVEQMYEEAGDSHFGKMKLEGHLILESPNALLTEADLVAIRVGSDDPRYVPIKDMDQMIMTVDSSHADDVKSDECGIFVMGKYGDKAHVIADLSGRMGPEEWGERIIEGLIAYPEIDRIVVEDDSSLVISVITKALHEAMERLGRRVRVVPVKHGNRSKKARAEPVVVKYALKKVLHSPCRRASKWRDLTKLEWQWKSWNPKGRGKGVKSPDRIDAVVYGVEYLLLRQRPPDTFYSPSGFVI